MLEKINKYCHGFAVVPSIIALKKRKFFDEFSGTRFSIKTVAEKYNGNTGNLSVVLRSLVSLGVLARHEGLYQINMNVGWIDFVNNDLVKLLENSDSFLFNPENKDTIEFFIDLANREWDIPNSSIDRTLIVDMLDGMLIIPVALSLILNKRFDEKHLNIAGPSCSKGLLCQFFEEKKWGKRLDEDCFQLSVLGEAIFGRMLNAGTVASYAPMFRQMDELLFGDSAKVFERDENGHESHIERHLNVIASGFQHEKYFKDIDNILQEIFNRPLEEQPHYVCDMGCGDGTLLKRIYHNIKETTLRGARLEDFPLVMIGADYNEKALAATKNTLSDIPHITIKGDIGDPGQLELDLAAQVDNVEDILHVRSFLDHDRPFIYPSEVSDLDSSVTYENVCVDESGALISETIVQQSLIEHLQRWGKLKSKFGLIILEVHSLPASLVNLFIEESENLHFDAYHAFSRQQLVLPEAFVMAAANAGLLPSVELGQSYPKYLSYSRITLNFFTHSENAIRFALQEDIKQFFIVETHESERLHSLIEENPRCILALLKRNNVVALLIMQLHTLDNNRVNLDLKKCYHRPDLDISDVRYLEKFSRYIISLENEINECSELSDIQTVSDRHTEPESIADSIKRFQKHSISKQDDNRDAELELEMFCARWVFTHLRKINLLMNVGDRINIEEMFNSSSIIPKYKRLFISLLHILEKYGVVNISSGSVRVEPEADHFYLDNEDLQVREFIDHFQEKYPYFLGFLGFCTATLEHYSRVLTGDVQANDLVFKDGDMDRFSNVFKGNKVDDYFNALVANAVVQKINILKNSNPQRKVRILEIGAGTGGCSQYIFKSIKTQKNVEYHYTDISSTFVRLGENSYGDYPFVVFERFDVTRDVIKQGFTYESFDIILASNVLHDTPRIDDTLETIKKLLVSDGIVIMHEYSSQKELLHYTGALLHGFWLFEDPEYRLPHTCLLSAPQWISVLERTGFNRNSAWGLPWLQNVEDFRQSVIIGELNVEKSELPETTTDLGRDIDAVLEKIIGRDRLKKIARDIPLMEVGLDSLEIVEFRVLLNKTLGIKLSSSNLFEYPTLSTLTKHVNSIKNNDCAEVLEANATRERKISHSQVSNSPAQSIIFDDLIKNVITKIIGLQRISTFDENIPFMENGLDSLEIVELRVLLNKKLKHKISSSDLFEHNTSVLLASYIQSINTDLDVAIDIQSPAVSLNRQNYRAIDSANDINHRDKKRDAEVQLRSVEHENSISDEIAITGLALRFPQNIDSLDDLWDLLKSEGSAITTLSDPIRTKNINAFANKQHALKGGFLHDIDKFDAGFFRLSPREVELMDPQQRMLLESCWHLFEDAGYAPASMRGKNIGVFIGACHYDYRNLLKEHDVGADAYIATGNSGSILSNRLSYFYNLEGPSLTVDTACSSSLVALHHALHSVKQGECEQAIVGGVNLICSLENTLLYEKAEMLSRTGQCRTFDNDADGYVRGEGLGLVLVKPLKAAIKDRDNVYAIIKGSAINHGGQASSITAPNPSAHARLIKKAISVSGVEPNSITYVEAHGTGTRLGDPIEVAGLKQAFANEDNMRCGIGSLKSSIGHLEGAAGIAGLIKNIACLKYQSLPRSANFKILNDEINLDNSPFYVVDSYEKWQTRKNSKGGFAPRRCGVSSFGFGGANAHVILEECVRHNKTQGNNHNSFLFLLSAKNRESLTGIARGYIDYLTQHKNIDLGDLCYTLLVGRDQSKHRLAIPFKKKEELIEKLKYFSSGEAHRAIFVGSSEDSQSILYRLLEKISITDQSPIEDKEVLAALWVDGYYLDHGFYSGEYARLNGLPKYYFNRESYWVNLQPNQESDKNDTRRAVFSGHEDFFTHHLINGQCVLPAAYYLALIINESKSNHRLQDINWIKLYDGDGDSIEVKINDDDAFSISVGNEIYCKGCLSLKTQDMSIDEIGLPIFNSNDAIKLDGAECYARLNNTGFKHLEYYQCLKRIEVGKDEARAYLSLKNTDNGYIVHPSVLDGAIQVALVMDSEMSNVRPLIPFYLDTIDIYSGEELPENVIVHVSKQTNKIEDRSLVVDIQIFSEEGYLLVNLTGLTLISIEQGKEHSPVCLKSVPTWRVSDMSDKAEPLSRKSVLIKDVGVALEHHHFNEVIEIPSDSDDLYSDSIKLVYEKLKTVVENPQDYFVGVVYSSDAELIGSAVTGLVKAACQEASQLFGKTINLGGRRADQNISVLLKELSVCKPFFEEVRLVGAERYIKEFPVSRVTSSVKPPLSSGVYWIIGGLGGVGKSFAEVIAKDPTCKVIISGRTNIENSFDKMDEVRRSGGFYKYIACDVTDKTQVERCFLQITNAYGPIKGVIYCAGQINDGTILYKNFAENVWASKVDGVLNVNSVLKEHPLEMFMVLSSVVTIHGNKGQSVYCAANSFIDTFAKKRQGMVDAGRLYGKTISIALPIIKGGMPLSESAAEGLYEKYSLLPMNTEDLIPALLSVVQEQASHILLGYGEEQGMKNKLFSQSISAELKDQKAVVQDEAATLEVSDVERYLTSILSKHLKIPQHKIDSKCELEDYGIDSIMIIDLTNEIEKDLGKISKTLFFENTTILGLATQMHIEYKTQLSKYLNADSVRTPVRALNQHSPSIAKNKAYTDNHLNSSSVDKSLDNDIEDIAIIGLGGRYPMADSLDEFWQNLLDGRNCVTEIPENRWSLSGFYDPEKGKKGYSYSKWGGFLSDIDKFDCRFFGISPREAELMDPQERLFLQTAWNTLEDSGYTREALENADGKRNVGVYVGAMYHEYQLYGAQAQLNSPAPALSGNPASIANRVSYCLGLSGPSMVVDTMCSSSLTAIHLACESIRSGNCEYAFAGGVNVSSHPNKYIFLSQGRFASSKGLCESFGDGGDGYVPGEGVGAVLLKPLAKAKTDGDHIYAVIKGSAINHGGKTNGYSVPNPNAQMDVIKDALSSANIDDKDISYIEAHGTGTSLGDPIEITGLSKAYQIDREEKCYVGSLKSNIGHAESAAGIAGLTKVILQLKNRCIVPSLHSQSLNRNIDFDKLPFVVPQSPIEWESAGNRIAGISSFGAGGANAHLIVQEYLEPPVLKSKPNDQYLIPLSAKTASALDVRVGQLISYLKKEGNPNLLHDISYNLCRGRESMSHRYACVANSIDQVIYLLNSYLQKKDNEQSLYGIVESTQINSQLSNQYYADLNELAVNWVAGKENNLSQHIESRDFRRLSLPPYPFEGKRHWINHEYFSTAKPAESVSHPYLRKNKNQYSCFLDPQLPVLKDHKVNDKIVFAGVNIIEVAGYIKGSTSQDISLKNVYWFFPIEITPNLPLQISVEYEDEKVSLYDKATNKTLVTSELSKSSLEGESIDISRAILQYQSNSSGSELYERFREISLHYGAYYRGIKQVYFNERSALVEIQLADHINTQGFKYFPGILDSALQAVYVLLKPGKTNVPFYMGEFSCRSPLVDPCYAHIEKIEEDSGNIKKFNIRFYSNGGDLLAIIKELCFREINKTDNVVKEDDQDFKGVQQLLAKDIEEILKIKTSDISASDEFEALGFESVTFAEFAQRINHRWQLKLTPTTFYSYHTIGELSKHVISLSDFSMLTQTEKLQEQSPKITEEDKQGKFQRTPYSSRSHDDVAIIGIHGIFPQAENLDEYWDNLVSGRNCITEIPETRWNWQDVYGDPNKDENKTNSKWGGFIPHVDKFDAGFFGISATEAQMMDPQQRLFMQSVWHSIEDAGYAAKDLSGKPVGVFVGAQFQDYQDVIADAGVNVTAHVGAGTAHSVLANRISYFFNFRGASEAIDTACSSSLVAINRAVKALQSGELEYAIAGGVSLILSPKSYIYAGQMGVFSNDGKCKTFDKKANGYVKGEGLGSLLLKPLRQAEDDGDPIYAVIRAAAEGHIGKSQSLTAPNALAQSELITRAYRKADISPDTIGYIETHGTGTELGDPIEIEGLQKSFLQLQDEFNIDNGSIDCRLGAVKTNVGHLEPAAGMAGILKLILCLQKKKLPPTIHQEERNPYINLEGSGLSIVDRLEKWEHKSKGGELVPLRGGVSSFGFGGSIAHIVLEEYRQVTNEHKPFSPQIILFSAKQSYLLERQLISIYAFTNKSPKLYLPSLAYTLQVGRESFKHKLAFICNSVDDLQATLKAIIDDGPLPTKVFKSVEDTFNTEEHLEFAPYLTSWFKDESVNWEALHTTDSSRRIHVPGYVFDTNSYWVNTQLTAKSLYQSQNKSTDESEVNLEYEAKKEDKKIIPAKAHDDYEFVALDWFKVSDVLKKPIEDYVCIDLRGENELSSNNQCIQFYDWDDVVETSNVEDRLKINLKTVGEKNIFFILPIVESAEQGVTLCAFLTRFTQFILEDNKPKSVLLVDINESLDQRSLAISTLGFVMTSLIEEPGVSIKVLQSDRINDVTLSFFKPLMLRSCVYFSLNNNELYEYREKRLSLERRGHEYLNGVYVISGGLGEIGKVFAKNINEFDQCKVVLLGRKTAGEAGFEKFVLNLKNPDNVYYYQIDITSKDQVSECINDIEEKIGELKGIIHSAGVLRDKVIRNTSVNDVYDVCRVKLIGAENLDSLSSHCDLDFFIACSSLAAVKGNLGQSSYAFANYYLDILCERRNVLVRHGERRGQSCSINWPYWKDGGFKVEEKWLPRIVEVMGHEPLSNTQGVEILLLALSNGVNGNFYPKLLNQNSAAENKKTDPSIGIIEYLVSIFEEVLQGEVDVNSTMESMGVDSFLSVKILSKLEEMFGELRKTLLFEYHTISELALYLEDLNKSDIEPRIEDSESIEIYQENNNSDADNNVLIEWLENLFCETLNQEVDREDIFSEIGVDSFNSVKIISDLEVSFGELDKTLLFEYNTITLLADYLLKNKLPHVQKLLETSSEHNDKINHLLDETTSIDTGTEVNKNTNKVLLCLEEHYPNQAFISQGKREYGNDAAIAMAANTVTPFIFIDSSEIGFFKLALRADIMLVVAYVGPEFYHDILFERIIDYCEEHSLSLNILSTRQIKSVANKKFTATPFGALQEITRLQEFSLEGKKMRRLRHAVNKYKEQGEADTIEYVIGSDRDTDMDVLNIINEWSSNKTKINPSIELFKHNVIDGKVATLHRVFITKREQHLDNVIVLSKMRHAYLMDLEFYSKDGAYGSLEFAIVKIIEILKGEGEELYSLGATHGPDIGDPDNTDAEVKLLLDKMRNENDFGAGNFQFKNKFRPENSCLYIVKPIGGRVADVHSILLMIADPQDPQSMALSRDSIDREKTLKEHDYNPAKISANQITYDLLSDSWAKNDYHFIDERSSVIKLMGESLTSSTAIKDIFPFEYIFYTDSGQQAEKIVFESMAKLITERKVLCNSLYPTNLISQISAKFEPIEVVCNSFLDESNSSWFSANIDIPKLEKLLDKDVAFVCVELGNNASGGAAVSYKNLVDLNGVLRSRKTPLFFDATRIIQNALICNKYESLLDNDNVWDLIRDILGFAETITASLSKGFSMDGGGIVCTNNAKLAHFIKNEITLHKINQINAHKQLATSLKYKDNLVDLVGRRAEQVNLIAKAFVSSGIKPLGISAGHCVLIDLKKIAPFNKFKCPAASFINWAFKELGLRCSYHSVGMSKERKYKDIVRFALPIGFPIQAVRQIVELIKLKLQESNSISELQRSDEKAQGFGELNHTYTVFKVHEKQKIEAIKKEQVIEENEIVIVGLAGRYPQASSINKLWEKLKSGSDCVSEQSASRWTERSYEACGQNSDEISFYGGFIDDVDKFDHEFFNMSKEEACLLDPHERLFLQTAWHALEDAGYTPESYVNTLESNNIGVFVGVVWSLYPLLGIEHGITDKINSLHHGVPNRVSFMMNFSGPSIAIDTACSSSLNALYSAYKSIKQGECKSAIVGGVNLDLHPSKQLGLKAKNMLSLSGRCRSYSSSADGYIPGEGVGAVVLKKYGDAVAHGDHIYGVVKGGATNHGGFSGGYSVPNVKALEAVVVDALDDAGVISDQVSYIEGHGTATEMGDSLEILSLEGVFTESSLRIGSVKSNIGHLEAAAGIASLTKVLLQLRYKIFVPSIHAVELNSTLKNKSFVRVQREVEKWQSNSERFAGISCFGAGGSNTHIIVQGVQSYAQVESRDEDDLFILSAASQEQLEQYVIEFINWLESDYAREYNFHDILYTLQVGRIAQKWRIGVVVSNKEALLSSLIKIKDEKEYFYNEVNKSKKREFKESLTYKNIVILENRHERLSEMCKFWLEGYEFAWDNFTPVGTKRVSTVVYPFAKKRCWLDELEVKQSPIKKDIIPPEKGSGELTDSLSCLIHSWKEVLSVADIDINDNFFDLGGDSFGAVKLVSLLDKKFNMIIPPETIFKLPTLIELHSYIESNNIDGKLETLTDNSDKKFLTAHQSWFFSRPYVDVNRWNIDLIYDCLTNIKPDLLRNSLEIVYQQHDILRASFYKEGSSWYWKVGSKSFDERIFSEIDMSDIDETDLESSMMKLKGRENRALNIEVGPMFRFALVKTKSQQLLVTTVHHLVSDFWSKNILVEDVFATYEKIDGGEQVELSQFASSSSELAISSLQFTQSEDVVTEYHNYWKNIPWDNIGRLPIDFDEGSNCLAEIQIVDVSMSESVTHKLLTELPKQLGIKTEDLLIFALSELFKKWMNTDWMNIFALHSGRTGVPYASHLNLARTIGWVAIGRQLVFPVSKAEDMESRLVETVKQLKNIPNKGFSGTLLAHCSTDNEIKEFMRKNIKNEVFFNYVGHYESSEEVSQRYIKRNSEFFKISDPDEAGIPPDEAAVTLLHVLAIMQEGRLNMGWMFSRSIFLVETIESLANDYKQILEELVELDISIVNEYEIDNGEHCES